MSIAQDLVYELDLSHGTQVINLNTPLVAGDKEAHIFQLKLFDDGNEMNLGGISCAGYFVRHKTKAHEADTIPIKGFVTGNTVSVTLSESCYSRSTYFAFVVRLTDSSTGQKRSIMIVRGMIVNGIDGDIVDPDDSIPSLDELFAQIAAMEHATEAANTAAASVETFKQDIQSDITSLSDEIDDVDKRAVYYLNPDNVFPKPDLPKIAATPTVGLPYSPTGVLVSDVKDGVNGVSLPSGGDFGFLLEIDSVISGTYTFSICRTGANAYNGRCSLQYLNNALGSFENVALDALTVENPVWTATIDVDAKKAAYSGLKYLRVMFGNTSAVTATFFKPLMILDSAKHTGFFVDNLLKYKQSRIYGKKLAVDGDSITFGLGYAGGYAGIIGERYSMTVQNNGIGGATLAAGTQTSEGTDRHWICDGISALDADADYVLISGMVNDFWNAVPLGELSVNKYNSILDDTTVIGAVERICREMVERFAGKKIGFLFTHSPNDWYRKDYTGAASTTANMTVYHDAIISALNKYSIPYCDLYMNSCFSTEITSLKQYTASGDGIHPTKEGYELFYVDKIVTFLESL